MVVLYLEEKRMLNSAEVDDIAKDLLKFSRGLQRISVETEAAHLQRVRDPKKVPDSLEEFYAFQSTIWDVAIAFLKGMHGSEAVDAALEQVRCKHD